MKVSIVIPNYNGRDILLKNLPKVLAEAKNSPAEVIVVDDCSTDDSIEILKDFEVKVFRNNSNLGFSSTVNKGVRESSGEIVVLLNSDVYPEKGFLENILGNFDDPKLFAVGAMDKSIEGRDTVLRGRGVGDWKRGFLVHKRGEVDKRTTLWVAGGSGAFRKEIWQSLGGLNELYNPFYWEDIDISYRALKSGYKILFDSKSLVNHEHSKGAIKTNYSSNQVKAISYRNQFLFVWLNATDLNLRIMHLLFLPYHFAKAALRLDLAFFEGFFKALILAPKVIESTFKYQRHFIKKDSEVIRELKE